MDVQIVRTAVSPLVILAMLERAHDALAGGDLVRGRQFVDGALRRLERAKADQDEALREWAATPEAPGTSLDLAAG
jgi:hypothetical protein